MSQASSGGSSSSSTGTNTATTTAGATSTSSSSSSIPTSLQKKQQQQHPDVISPSAYAMSASVERSAECVLAVLSTNTPVVPAYGRSISSPCGDTRGDDYQPCSSTSSSPTKESNENEPAAAACMRRSYPGAMNEKRSDSNSSSKSRHDSNHHVASSNGGSVHNNGSQGEEEEEEEEDESFASGRGGVDDDNDVEAGDVPSGEEPSQAESIPDSFHTPSASIQNLNSSANLIHSNFKSVQQQHMTNVNNKAARSSTRSNASSSSSSGNSGKGSESYHHRRSGSNGSGNSSGNKSDSEHNKKESPKRKGSSGSGAKKDSDSLKGSPEGSRKDVAAGIISSVEAITPPQTSVVLEVTQSVESKESSLCSSGGSSIASGSIREHQHPMIIGTPARFHPKPNKKKMWYHVFYPSYKTRSSDFKRIFKDLPAEERLIVDYSCALQREILIQGRMYVSQNFISFYANIFGWETQTSIRLRDVTSITKEKTALIIPNAVQVSTESERFFFTSFVTRDSTFMMLFKLWQSCLLEEVDNPIPTKEIWKLVHSCYGDELGVASEEDTEEFIVCPDTATGTVVNAPSVTTLISTASEGDDAKSVADLDAQVCASELGAELGVHPVTLVGADGPVTLLNVPEIGLGISSPTTDASDTTESDGDGETSTGAPIASVTGGKRVSVKTVTDGPVLLAAVDDLVCPIPHTEGREVVSSIIPTDVDTLFTMLFTSSKFFLDLHTARKTFDIVQSAWQQNPDGSQKTRQVSFTVTLNHVMGPKHSQVTESQVMLPVSKPGRLYVIEVESVNAGIPYADSFYVTAHFCLTRVSAHETKLCIVNQIKYKKSVWKYTKGFIEKNTWAGLEEFYTYLERALKEECTKANELIQSPLVAPVLAGSARRRGGRKKYPAPGIPCDVVAATPAHSVIRNGSIPIASVPLAVGNATVSAGSQTTAEGSLVLKIILGVLACLFFLNAFLYVKLTRFETSKSHNVLLPPRPIALPQNVPRNHEEWMALLQEQEDLHRLELQKWHEILLSALQVLQQAEEDLESLKFHIKSYDKEKFSVNSFKRALDSLESRAPESQANTNEQHDLDRTDDDDDNSNQDERHKASDQNYRWNSREDSSFSKDADIRREL